MWSGQRRVADQVEIWFGATGNHCEANRKSIAAFCLDIAQDSFALKAIEAFAHRQGHSVFCKVVGEPPAGVRIDISVQQIGIPMHETDLQFHHPKTGGRLACEQSAAYDHDAFLQGCHLF